MAESFTGVAKKIMDRAKPICPDYARLYMAWVKTPPEKVAERKKKLSEVRSHLIVCGCAYGATHKQDWIFTEDKENG